MKYRYKKKDTICHFLLEEKGILYEDIENVINSLIIFRKKYDNDVTYTKKFQEIILYSKTLAVDLASKYVYDEHIFYVMLKEEDYHNLNIALAAKVNLLMRKMGFD